MLQDRRELLEPPPQDTALPRRVLQQHHRLVATPRLERLANAAGDEPEGGVFTSSRTRAWMNDDAQQAKDPGAIQLVDERRDRLRPKRRDRRREVDQVARVRHDRLDAGLVHTRSKPANLDRVERRRLPAVRVLAEDLERFAAVQLGAIDRFRHAACHRHVRADAKHSCPVYFNWPSLICRAR